MADARAKKCCIRISYHGTRFSVRGEGLPWQIADRLWNLGFDVEMYEADQGRFFRDEDAVVSGASGQPWLGEVVQALVDGPVRERLHFVHVAAMADTCVTGCEIVVRLGASWADL